MSICKKLILNLLWAGMLMLMVGCPLDKLDEEGVTNALGLDQVPKNIDDTTTEETDLNAAICGDGNVDSDDGEECDDGNTETGDTCNSDCMTNTDFVSVWNVEESDKTITLPLIDCVDNAASCSSDDQFTYDFTVCWGDEDPGETCPQVTSFDDSDATHTYDEAGEYTVTISGTMETINFHYVPADRDIITSIPNLGVMGWKSFTQAFRLCSNLGEIYGGDTSAVNKMHYMFRDSPANPDTSGWDTSNVTDMGAMFANYGAPFDPPTNLDTSEWNTENVTSMSQMFYGSTANPDTSGWDTSSVTGMYIMFKGATNANPDTSGWNLGLFTNTGTGMREIFTNSGISDANYSKFLIMAANTSGPSANGMNIASVPADYFSGDAADARGVLTGNSWLISDGNEITPAGEGASCDVVTECDLNLTCENGTCLIAP